MTAIGRLMIALPYSRFSPDRASRTETKRPLPSSTKQASDRARIFAEHSPFDMKDHLKARGYRWSDGSDGRPKSWWIELAEDAVGEELGYLRSEIYRWDEADPPVKRLTAFDRFKA